MAKLKSKRVSQSKAKKQKKLLALSEEIHESKLSQDSVVAIFLIRQGIRVRSEQFTGIADCRSTAIEFCRNTLMPQAYSDNQKKAIHYQSESGEALAVNGEIRDTLLIKGIDFTRKEEGRINSNPLWFWNIVDVTVFKSLKSLTKTDNTK